MKSFKKLVALISLAFLTAIFASNFTTAYADGTTQVNITNVDIASLSNFEKELIISGKPTGVVNSTTSVKLVYKTVGCPVDKPSLPNTGTSTGLVTLGAGILVLGAAYALLKSNKGKKLVTILFVIGAGSILVGSVDASQVILNGETKVVSISQEETTEETTTEQTESEEVVTIKPGTPAPA